MKRIAIFASYNSEGVIAEYVLYYLRGLKKVAEEIIFIADNSVSPEEEVKLKGLVTYSKCERHGCYDFGSYRRGFEWADANGLLDDADELIFCNDSCYGPIYPFEKVFAKMAQKECDFWGMVESHEIRSHLQSYFLVFKNKVFQSQNFKDYVHSFEKQDGFWGYVKNYETNFAGHLSEAGFTYTAYLNLAKYEKENNNNPINPTVFPIKTLTDGMPLLKKKVFGCEYCAVLRDVPKDVIDFVESVNKDIYKIIMHDIGKGISDLQRPLRDELVQLRKHADNLEKMNKDQRVHIANLEQARKEMSVHISNLERILEEQDRHLHNRHNKIIMLIWGLIIMFIISILSIVCISF